MQTQDKVINGFRLSPQQKRVWNLQKDSIDYRVQAVVTIEGSLKADLLKLALEQIIDRHEILRTSFIKPPGIKTPIQTTNAQGLLFWQEIDLSDRAYPEQLNQVESLYQQERLIPWHFEQGALLRAALIKLSVNKSILLLNLPAICADSWSIKNLVQEISQCYGACLQGIGLNNEEVVQYLQFSEWQNELLADTDAEFGKQYWKKYNLSALPKLSLPFENKLIVDSAKFSIGSYKFKMESKLLVKIAAIVEKYQFSISDFLLSCWQILLWRFAKKSNIVIGLAADGRKYEELETVVGLITKYLPISLKLENNLVFREVLQIVSESVQEAGEWQEYFAWENFAGFTDTDIDSAYLPFNFEFQVETAKYYAEEVCFSINQQFACTDRFKIKLSCHQKIDCLTATFDYDVNLFTAEVIELLAGNFQTLVESAVDAPNTRIDHLEILNENERQQLLTVFNNTQANFPQDKCFQQLFAEQVLRTPESIAVVFEDQKLTYEQLNSRSNQLAHYLQKLGVKPEVLVGIYMERSSKTLPKASLDMIVSLLAILKAGGAYLPLDPALPAAALAYRLQDAGVSVLLTQRSLISKIPTDTTHIICLDTDWEVINSENPEDCLSKVQANNLVYAIYTSGSTGQPKAVAIAHRQLVNYIYAIIDRLDFAKGASFATVSTFAADLGNTVIFPALCTGGCLHIISQETAADPQALADYFQRHPIDYLKIVPSHLAALLAASPTSSILPRKSLILGGEASSWQLINQLQELAGECQIFNHYGPTETTVGVLTYPITQQTQQLSSTVPLGQPLANTQVYVLDEQLQLVPIGVPGELYIGGAGLARGYLNQPELTATRFIQNPFVSDSQARLYKTGDQVRYLIDGNLEFLGRVDRQVKIRGFRIELEEIETTLKQHSGVQEVVVTATEETLGNKRLVAYIVINPQLRLNNHNYQATASVLRSFCLDKLPEYAIPSTLVLLKALPLTANGKIDYQALPTPEQNRPELEQVYVAPRTNLERQLAEIWSEILGLEQVGIYDNFFELGGHSLLITQLLAKFRKALRVELPLKVLFDAPTIAELAAQIDSKQIADTSTINLDSEAILDPSIVPATKYIHKQTPPTAILLTGATGFLGAFLLYELLQQTTADIYCLIRAKTTAIATEKLQNHLKSYLLWDESFHERIIPLIGDLSQSLLGLSVDKFAAIAAQIDIIYHNGAFVNFTYPYSQLKAANVLATQEILRLAAEIKVKPVHFISTIGVVGAADSAVEIIREETPINHSAKISSGYTQSKWVAEKLVTIAGDRGIPISIYRPGRISGDSKTGVCNIDDHTFRMIRGCIQLGSVPKDNTMVNLTPVDYASQAIVYLSQQEASLGQVFHLINPQPLPWGEVVNSIVSFGYSLKQIDYPQWRSQLLKEIERSPDNPLCPLVATITNRESQNTSIEDSATQQIDMQNTFTGLAETTIICPPLNQQLLNTYLSYLIRSGFLQHPSNHN
jgi:amino acid adenylation domain-containing protein/thioester reductase-like protein